MFKRLESESRLSKAYRLLCIRSAAAGQRTFERHAGLSLFLLGVGLLYGGASELAHAGSGTYGQACDGLLQLVEGTFGALITAAAGVGAIVASAVGGFKMAWALVVVSVGAFILRSFITLFNGTCGG